MFPLLTKRPGLGLEINSSAIRLVALQKNGASATVLSARTVVLPPGMLREDYGSSNIHDYEGFKTILRESLDTVAHLKTRQVGICLPDGVFRVQTLEFDQLPSKRKDRERFIRWRLEKTSAFDSSDTLLRYQILQRQDRGYTLLACVAKYDVMQQYETLITDLGYEPWSVGLTSFSAVNFFAPFLLDQARVSSVAYITNDSFITTVLEGGGLRFYRFKEMKRGKPADVHARLVRDIDDSLHFYTHMDRSQITQIAHLYLAGDYDGLDTLAGRLAAVTSFETGILSPAAVHTSYADLGSEMAGALGGARDVLV